MTQRYAQLADNDGVLLTRFIRHKSEDAFAELVQRYRDLVYATSLRRVGDPHLAEDVTQATFIVLAQRAHTIGLTPLPAWLHRTACYAANNALKMKSRRIKHEQAAAMKQRELRTDDFWNEIEPLLDDALNRLSEADRCAMLLRYYQSMSVDEVARSLNLSLEGAKKRLQRALKKLRALLSGKGITLSLAALTTTLELNASVIGAAPTILATTTAAVATAASSSTPTAAALISKGVIAMLVRENIRSMAISIIVPLFLLGGIAWVMPQLFAGAVTRQVDTASVAPATAPLSPRFSDVIELTVNDDGLRKDECIDFDKGVLITGPQNGFRTREEGNRWFRESGADCHAETQTGEAGLYPVQMAVVPAEREDWDNMSAEDLVKNMSDAVPQRRRVSSEDELPVTFAFKTREGGIGIAQITAMDRGADEHGTITVRFKLVK